MLQHDAQTQISVDLVVVVIRSAHQRNSPVVDHKAVGLAIQITGRKRSSVKGFPQHIIEETDVVLHPMTVAPGVQEHQILDGAFGLKIPAFGLDIHIGHAENIDPQPLGFLHTVTKGNDRCHFQRRVDSQGLLHPAAVGKGDPAGIQSQIGQIQYHVFHQEACIEAGSMTFLTQQHQILGRSHQKLIIACSALQRFLAVIPEQTQTCPDLRKQTLCGIVEIGSYGLGDGKRHLFVHKGTDGFSVLDQCTVIHIISSPAEFFF